LAKALKIFDTVNYKICYVSMAAAFFLMVMTTVHAIIRKFFGSGGIVDSLGITELVMALIIFCSLAYMESERGHVRMDILANKIPGRGKYFLNGVLLLITGVFIFIMFWANAGNIVTIYGRGAATAVLHIPTWPFVIVMCVGLFVYAVTVLLHGIECFGKRDEEGGDADVAKEIDVSTQM